MERRSVGIFGQRRRVGVGGEADTQVQQKRDVFEALADLEDDAARSTRVMLEGLARLGRESFTLGTRVSSKVLRMYLSSLRRAGEALVPPFLG